MTAGSTRNAAVSARNKLRLDNGVKYIWVPSGSIASPRANNKFQVTDSYERALALTVSPSIIHSAVETGKHWRRHVSRYTEEGSKETRRWARTVDFTQMTPGFYASEINDNDTKYACRKTECSEVHYIIMSSMAFTGANTHRYQ